ncbi:hypothetical protein CP971_05460 [Streptomyces viridifaciens]|nr:hypothetical protein CP971_05460 [Streptomyces viridifaciens]
MMSPGGGKQIGGLDAEAVRQAAQEVRKFAEIDDAKRTGGRLEAFVRALLPEVCALRAALPSGTLRAEADRVINWVEAVGSRDYGFTLDSAAWHVDHLAASCRLLLGVADLLNRRESCHRCSAKTTDLRPVRVGEANSGPGRAIHACEDCRKRSNLTPLTDTQRPGGTLMSLAPIPDLLAEVTR